MTAAFTGLAYCRRRVLKCLSSACFNSFPNSPAFLHVRKVLGIETSCDDTGAAVVDENGHILGESLISQSRLSVELGGVLPPVATELHKQHIDEVIETALSKAAVETKDLDAIAVTTKPGLPWSLHVGLSAAQKLIRETGVPMIPIHHMEAHALTARMIHKIDFPFLVFLLSGGHCLLAVARDIDDFLLLGTTLDKAPGEAFDKVARRLKLKNIPQCDGLSGGASLELIAKGGNQLAFKIPHIMLLQNNCNFSFGGLLEQYIRYVEEEERKQEIFGGDVIGNAADVCASFQYAILRHLASRLKRALLFCEMKTLLPKNKCLVVSGGVACNHYLRRGLQAVCDEFDCELVCPPPNLCTDNGIMIAWNGIEKLRKEKGFSIDPFSETVEHRCPFGTDITAEVSSMNIRFKPTKFL